MPWRIEDVLVGRIGVDVVGFDRHALFGLRHRHRRAFAEQLRGEAPAARIEVLNDDEGDAAVRWHQSQQLADGVETAR